MKNYYRILGVRYDATIEEIEAAYQALSSKLATDEQLANYKQAYIFLTDVGARDIYDQSLRAQAQPSSLPPLPRVDTRSLRNHEAPDDFGARSGQLKVGPEAVKPIPWALILGIVLAILAIIGLLLYKKLDHDQQTMRMEREKQIELRARQAEEDRKREEEERKADAEQRRKEQELRNAERENRRMHENAIKDVDRLRDFEQNRLANQQREEANRRQRELDAELRKKEQQEAREARERQERERRNLEIIRGRRY